MRCVVVHTKKLIWKIESILKSDLSPYKIAKKVGYASANPVHKLIAGQTKIEHMTLKKAKAFEKLYEEYNEEQKK